MIQIYDNMFDKEYLYFIDRYVNGCSFTSNNIANRKTIPYGTIGTHKLFGSTLYHREDINDISVFDDKNFPVFYELFNLIQDRLNKLFILWTCKLNLQHSGCDGTIHKDTVSKNNFGKYSLMMFTNAEWKNEWGGEFEINNEKIEYIPGRIILFDGSIPHRGFGPNSNHPYVYRTSLVYIVDYFNEWIDSNKINKI